MKGCLNVDYKIYVKARFFSLDRSKMSEHLCFQHVFYSQQISRDVSKNCRPTKNTLNSPTICYDDPTTLISGFQDKPKR